MFELDSVTTIPVILETAISKTGKPYVSVVADLGYSKKRLAFGRDALDLFGFSVRDLTYDDAPKILATGHLSFDS